MICNTWLYCKAEGGLQLDFEVSISTAGNDKQLLTSDELVTNGIVGMTKSVCFCLCILVIFENWSEVNIIFRGTVETKKKNMVNYIL